MHKTANAPQRDSKNDMSKSNKNSTTKFGGTHKRNRREGLVLEKTTIPADANSNILGLKRGVDELEMEVDEGVKKLKQGEEAEHAGEDPEVNAGLPGQPCKTQ